MARWRRATTCERAGQWISLRLDGELSELECVALERHLERCTRCEALAADLNGISLLLREAPLVEFERAPIAVLPGVGRRQVRRRVAAALALMAAAAAAAIVAISTSPPPEFPSSAPAFRSAAEQIRYVRAEQHRLEPPRAEPVAAVAPRVAWRSL